MRTTHLLRPVAFLLLLSLRGVRALSVLRGSRGYIQTLRFLYRASSRILCWIDPYPTVSFRGLRLVVDAQDFGMVPDLFIQNFENPLLEEFEEQLLGLVADDAGLDPLVFIDGGANVGIYSLLAAKLGGRRLRIYSFEPNPSTAALFSRNVTADFPETVEVVPMALGEKNGVGALDISSPCKCAHSLHGGGEQSVEVPLISLDDFSASRGLKPRLIKLDIEGEEYSAMRGMSEVLRGCDPILFVEFNPRALQRAGSTGESFLSYIEQHFRHIRFFGFDRDDIPPVVYRAGDDATRARMLAEGGNLVIRGYREA